MYFKRQQNEKCTQKRNILWDIKELDWDEVIMTSNGKKINLPAPVIIPLRDIFVPEHNRLASV